MDAGRFAKALADVIGTVLPSEFALEARDGRVTVRAGSLPVTSSDLRGFFSDEGNQDEEVIAAAMSVLSAVQDAVSEALTVPWPQERASQSLRMAMPGAAIHENRLTLWFGRPDAPSLAVGDIDVERLRHRGA